uniref:Uncharacterized protein n=1 Tax=Tanacetum cinerariifolium TaxID=118510 RepID=A0A6L2K1I3_TANCI|nr:hypothetical protein [Tanacetum cinerariifolium]
MRKINFKKAVLQMFKEYDQKLEALTSINVYEVIDKAVQTKVLTEMKKLLPTHVPKALANYGKSRLNNSMLEVMENNQINLFTKPSTDTDDLSQMDLKLKLLKNTSKQVNATHPTHQKLYDTLYESITLDQEALNAQDAKPSFHKRTHNDQDPPNHHEGENMKKRRKDKDELTIADLKGAGLEKLKIQYKNDVELKYHVDKLKSTKPHPSFYNNDFYYMVNFSIGEKYTTSLIKHFAARYHIHGIKDMFPERWSKKIHCYQIEALNGIHHWEDERQDFFKAKINNRSLMKLSEIHKFCDGTLMKIHDNLFEMVNKNQLGHGNIRLKRWYWNDKDIKRSNEMLDKIDQTLKCMEQLRRFEEYVGGCPKTIGPRFYARP